MAKEKQKLTASELRQRIVAAKDIKLEEMEIEEWGVTVWVKALTYEERSEAMEAARMEGGDESDVKRGENFQIAAILVGVRDEDGNPVFSKEDVKELRKKNSSVLDKISEKITEISGFGARMEEALKKRFRERK